MNNGYFKIKLEDRLGGCSDGKGDRGLLWMLREETERKLTTLAYV